MTTWLPAPGTYIGAGVEIRKFCQQAFGAQHIHQKNLLSGKTIDNHGRWRIGMMGEVQFRYEKDLAWFLLSCSHLVDPPRWPFYAGPRSK